MFSLFVVVSPAHMGRCDSREIHVGTHYHVDAFSDEESDEDDEGACYVQQTSCANAVATAPFIAHCTKAIVRKRIYLDEWPHWADHHSPE